ncbi:MAG: nitroreductase [Clostridiales bacterium]|nr:nitroreductase [Clostridiales bacterium]
MNHELLYPMIFKRKSFHLFRNNKTREYYSDTYRISDEEYEDILNTFHSLDVLYPDIKTDIRIADNEETTCKRGQEKVLLLYSEDKDNYLMNMGYIGEQLDLYLASKNIGTLWFGMNKADMPDYNGLKYVIMIAISKVPEDSFRKDMFKAKRKDIGQIWQGDEMEDIPNIIRFAPSACNTQPWKVINEDSVLKVYRYVAPIRKWVMPIDGVLHYNHIDIGIFLCFLELCLKHHDISYERQLFTDDRNDEMNKVGEYKIS